MKHPLDGARLKVIRAQEHLDCLKAEVWMYLHQQPDEVRSQPQRSPQHTWLRPTHVLPPIVPAEPPPRLSAIIGDCVTNARAALDYIMWELAERHFDPPLDIRRNPDDMRLSAFPIFGSRTDKGFKKRFNSLAKRKVPPPAITQLKRVQPYNARHKPLLSLRDLVNRDKHATLLLTIGEVGDMTVEFSAWHLSDIVREPEKITIPRNLTTEKQPALQSDMPMKGKAAIYVTWKDASMPREPVDLTLEKIVKCVGDIIPRFDSFFI